MSPDYLLSSYGNFESEPSVIGNKLILGPSRTLTRRCQDDKLFPTTVIQGLPSASFHYRHQIERHQQEAEAYSTMVCSFSARMASSEKQQEVCIKKYSSMMIEYLPKNSRAGCLPRTKLEESETCQSHRVLCSIFSSNLTEELGRERIWMDLSFLHIWMQDAVAVAGVVLNGSERNILHGLQWPHSFPILQERREGSSLDSHQARHSSNWHGVGTP